VIFERDVEWSRGDGLIASSGAKYDAAFAVRSNASAAELFDGRTQNNALSRQTPPTPHGADQRNRD
jgi:hypothetical protein